MSTENDALVTVPSTPDNSAMIEYLTAEITTLATNTMTFRSRITFSIFIGPFLLLGSIIILSARQPLTFGLVSQWTWKMTLAAGIAIGGFVFFGIVAGRIEQGALNRCNEWRKCIVRLQTNEKLSAGYLTKHILDKQTWNATCIYVFAYVAILATFVSTVYLTLKFVSRA